jgi:carbonic anhydrase/acetyltransferase-like protein (isoleucine patch superfamily)
MAEEKEKKKIKLPKIKLPKISLPKLNFDFRWLFVALFVAAIALLNTFLVVRFAGPKLILKDPRMTRFAEEGEHVDENLRQSDSGKLPRYVLSPSMVNRYNTILDLPEVEPSSYIHRQAFIMGGVSIGKKCYVGPHASIRGDIGQGIHLGDESNVQDGAVITGLPSEDRGETRKENVFLVDGKAFSVYLGNHVSLAPQSQVHGPALLGEGCFVGMQALVFRSKIGKNCVLEPRSAAIGVEVPENRYIAAGRLVSSQQEANALPHITAAYPYEAFGSEAVKVHVELAEVLHGK